MYVLDTDHMSTLERGGSNALLLATKLSPIADSQIATTIITYEEQCRGWLAKTAKETGPALIRAYTQLAKHLHVYSSITVLQYDERAYEIFLELQQHKFRIGTQDLKIASIVLANDSILLTRNTRHFEKVSNLRIDDWTV